MLEKIQYEEDLPIKVQVLEIEQYPWHMHEDIQIIYVMEGEIELKMTYARYRLTKDNIHFIHSDDVHGIKSLTKTNLVVILSFQMEYFSKAYPDLDTQVFSTKVSEDIATYKKQLTMKARIFSIISEFHGKEKGYKSRIETLSLELIDTLYENFRGFTVNLEKRTFEHQISHDMVQIDRISRVISLVYQNYPYKISLAAIAKDENINNYYLSHLFQRLVGYNFRNFLSMVRVEMSEAELLITNSSITQISQNVGFSNAKYYIENFKEWFGCSPKEYRQLYKNEVIGRALVKKKELPLDSINDVISSYGQLPAFTGAAEEIRSARFRPKESGLKLCPWKIHPIQPEIYYAKENPQLQCLELLKEMTRPPLSPPTAPQYKDTDESHTGLFTFNGLKKPLYWVYQFMDAQMPFLVQYDSWYILTSDEQQVRILFFNDDAKKEQTFEFHLFQMSGSYKVVQHRLQADRSCIHYWQQLNFKTPLSKTEKEQIERMSAPAVSFRTIRSSDSFTYSIQLDCLEIAFLEIEPCE